MKPLMMISLALGLLSGTAHAAPTSGWSSEQLLDNAEQAVVEERIGDASLLLHRAELLVPSSGLSAHRWNLALWGGVGLTGLGLFGFVSRRPRLGWAAGVMGASLMTVSGAALESASMVREVGIVMRSAELRTSPAQAATPLGQLAPGEEVSLVGKSHGDYVAVEVAGHRGWVRSVDVVPLVPSEG